MLCTHVRPPSRMPDLQSHIYAQETPSNGMLRIKSNLLKKHVELSSYAQYTIIHVPTRALVVFDRTIKSPVLRRVPPPPPPRFFSIFSIFFCRGTLFSDEHMREKAQGYVMLYEILLGKGSIQGGGKLKVRQPSMVGIFLWRHLMLRDCCRGLP